MKRLFALVTLVIMAAFMFVMTPDRAEAATPTEKATINCEFEFTFPTEEKVCKNLDPSISQFVTTYSNLSTDDVKVQVDAGSCQKDIRTIPKLTEDDTQSYKCGNVNGAIFTHLEKKGTVTAIVSQ